MAIVDALLPEFDREMTTTRTLLERVPDDRLEWKPHAKSMSLGQLAAHVATIPIWGHVAMIESQYDLDSSDTRPAMTTRAEIVAAFDRYAGDARAAIDGRTDAELLTLWSLMRSQETLFSAPRAMVWRGFVLNHLIHHRGQLSVYLRILDVPIPSIYGPSADENPF
ncbi:MAG: DUF664 domain-containing protein [Acidobacteria bacterium]|nr:DUF664 domain-containing protein [Acidobacteriota bacterium]